MDNYPTCYCPHTASYGSNSTYCTTIETVATCVPRADVLNAQCPLPGERSKIMAWTATLGINGQGEAWEELTRGSTERDSHTEQEQEVALGVQSLSQKSFSALQEPGRSQEVISSSRSMQLKTTINLDVFGTYCVLIAKQNQST